MDVSVIIVNYNTKDITLNCINSIFEKTSGFTFEVIVVDNHSLDGSKELFEIDERIIYIYNSENVGFGKANNIGFKYSHGDYMLFLNSDTYLVNNAIYELWKQTDDVFKTSTNPVGSSGMMLLTPQGDYTHSYAKFPSMTGTFLGYTFFPILYKMHLLRSLPNSSNYGYRKDKSFFEVDYITGADLMIRKDIADTYGLFDEDFFMYFEETELQYRYKKSGLRRMIFEGPAIVHLEGGSNKKSMPVKNIMYLNSMLLYFKKTRPFLIYLLFCFIFKAFAIICYMISFPFVHGSARDKFRFIVNLMRP